MDCADSMQNADLHAIALAANGVNTVHAHGIIVP